MENFTPTSVHPQNLPLPTKRTLAEHDANAAPESQTPPKVVVRSHEEPQQLLMFKRLSEQARAPVRSSVGAVGYDLCSAVEKTVPAHGKTVVPTDIAVAIPAGCYGRVAPRSGLAAKNFIDVGAGVIDPDYRGNLGVVLFNHSDVDFEVKPGDRIAQLILEVAVTPPIVEVAELDSTVRGASGYGSTGVR